jgi:hypothetical protein
MGIHFSLGTVSQAHGLVRQALSKPVAQLHVELQHAPVCHTDETRHKSHRHTLWNPGRGSEVRSSSQQLDRPPSATKQPGWRPQPTVFGLKSQYAATAHRWHSGLRAMHT